MFRKLMFVLSIVVISATGFILYVWYSSGEITAPRSVSTGGVPFDADLQQILQYGAMAPSGHNTQVWKVRVLSDRRIEVLLDERRLLPEADADNRDSYISIGAFIENIAQAAPYFGLQARVTVAEKQAQGQPVAFIEFVPAPPTSVAEQAIDNIKLRHTIRTGYSKEKLQNNDLAVLRAISPNLHWFELNSREGQQISKIQREAFISQTKDDAMQEELADWVRYSKQEAVNKKDGLNPESMGLSRMVKGMFYLFVNRQNFASDTSRKQSIAAAQEQLANCAGFIIITGRGGSACEIIEAGRESERLWLKAAELKLALQPLASMLEVPGEKQKLESLMGEGVKPMMAFRIGYVEDYGQPTSWRRDLKDWVIVDKAYKTEK